MEYSAQIIARLFVPKVASRRKRESDKQKEKAMHLEKKITVMKQYKSGKHKVGNSFHLHLHECTSELQQHRHLLVRRNGILSYVEDSLYYSELARLT